jgi:GH43 family beta-xylosidase
MKFKRTLITLLLLALTASLLGGTVPAFSATSSTTFLNPVGPSGMGSADPHVYKHTDGYYYYVHTHDNWSQIDLVKATSLTSIGIGERKTVFVKSRACSGTSCYSKNIWAPEIYNIDGVWHLYFSAGGEDGHQRMWVISNTSADPMQGTWSSPIKINTPNTWSIDHTVANVNGQWYMAWSESTNHVQRILISKMSSPTTLTGPAVMISEPIYNWEKIGANPQVNEAPHFITHGNKVHLTYSASGCWTDDYALGLLSADITADLTVISNWTKSSSPVFSKTSTVFGPGHNSFTKSPDGTEDWIVYHANPGSGQGCGSSRTTRIQKITWDANDNPILGEPVTPGIPVVRPSGESGLILYALRNKSSQKMLTVQGGSTADGANIYQWTYQGNNEQKWTIEPTDSGFFEIRAYHSGKLAGVTDSSTMDGANVAQYTDADIRSQQWKAFTTGDHYFKLQNRNSGKMLDNENGGTKNETNVRQWSDNGADPQRWIFERLQ